LTSGLGARRRCVVFNHHHPEAQMPDSPTHKQMNYLRTLAQRTGQTFATPRTKAEASSEIRRMRAIQPGRTARSDARREAKDVVTAIHADLGDATAFRDHETTGYGSTARWA
jgi:hypothetical protein